MEPENSENINEESKQQYSYASTNFPEFRCEIDPSYVAWGAKEASYLVGFAGAINQLGFSEETLGAIINNKISLEYQKELFRMQLESEERVANIVAKTPVTFVAEN